MLIWFKVSRTVKGDSMVGSNNREENHPYSSLLLLYSTLLVFLHVEIELILVETIFYNSKSIPINLSIALS